MNDAAMMMKELVKLLSQKLATNGKTYPMSYRWIKAVAWTAGSFPFTDHQDSVPPPGSFPSEGQIYIRLQKES